MGWQEQRDWLNIGWNVRHATAYLPTDPRDGIEKVFLGTSFGSVAVGNCEAGKMKKISHIMRVPGNDRESS